jgi:hypothetical protein
MLENTNEPKTHTPSLISYAKAKIQNSFNVTSNKNKNSLATPFSDKKGITSPVYNKNTNSVTNSTTNSKKIVKNLSSAASNGNLLNLAANINSNNQNGKPNVNFSSIRQYVHSQVNKSKIINKINNMTTIHMRSTSISNH